MYMTIPSSITNTSATLQKKKIIIIVNTSQYMYITQYTQVFNIILIIIAIVLYMFITDMSVVTLHSTIEQLVLTLEFSHTTQLEIVFSHQ